MPEAQLLQVRMLRAHGIEEKMVSVRLRTAMVKWRNQHMYFCGSQAVILIHLHQK